MSLRIFNKPTLPFLYEFGYASVPLFSPSPLPSSSPLSLYSYYSSSSSSSTVRGFEDLTHKFLVVSRTSFPSNSFIQSALSFSSSLATFFYSTVYSYALLKTNCTSLSIYLCYYIPSSLSGIIFSLKTMKITHRFLNGYIKVSYIDTCYILLIFS